MAADVQLRCHCTKRPLLGVCGRDARTGEPFVHLKVFKQGRVFGEVVVTSGEFSVRCRECLRWHHVRVRRTTVAFEQQDLPASIPV